MSDCSSEEDVFFGPITEKELRIRKKRGIDDLEKTVLLSPSEYPFPIVDADVSNVACIGDGSTYLNLSELEDSETNSSNQKEESFTQHLGLTQDIADLKLVGSEFDGRYVGEESTALNLFPSIVCANTTSVESGGKMDEVIACVESKHELEIDHTKEEIKSSLPDLHIASVEAAETIGQNITVVESVPKIVEDVNLESVTKVETGLGEHANSTEEVGILADPQIKYNYSSDSALVPDLQQSAEHTLDHEKCDEVLLTGFNITSGSEIDHKEKAENLNEVLVVSTASDKNVKAMISDSNVLCEEMLSHELHNRSSHVKLTAEDQDRSIFVDLPTLNSNAELDLASVSSDSKWDTQSETDGKKKECSDQAEIIINELCTTSEIVEQAKSQDAVCSDAFEFHTQEISKSADIYASEHGVLLNSESNDSASQKINWSEDKSVISEPHHVAEVSESDESETEFLTAKSSSMQSESEEEFLTPAASFQSSTDATSLVPLSNLVSCELEAAAENAMNDSSISDLHDTVITLQTNEVMDTTTQDEEMCFESKVEKMPEETNILALPNMVLLCDNGEIQNQDCASKPVNANVSVHNSITVEHCSYDELVLESRDQPGRVPSQQSVSSDQLHPTESSIDGLSTELCTFQKTISTDVIDDSIVSIDDTDSAKKINQNDVPCSIHVEMFASEATEHFEETVAKSEVCTMVEEASVKDVNSIVADVAFDESSKLNKYTESQGEFSEKQLPTSGINSTSKIEFSIDQARESFAEDLNQSSASSDLMEVEMETAECSQFDKSGNAFSEEAKVSYGPVATIQRTEILHYSIHVNVHDVNLQATSAFLPANEQIEFCDSAASKQGETTTPMECEPSNMEFRLCDDNKHFPCQSELKSIPETDKLNESSTEVENYLDDVNKSIQNSEVLGTAESNLISCEEIPKEYDCFKINYSESESGVVTSEPNELHKEALLGHVLSFSEQGAEDINKASISAAECLPEDEPCGLVSEASENAGIYGVEVTLETEENENAYSTNESDHSELQKDISSQLDANGLCADSRTTSELTALSEKCSADNAAVDSVSCDITGEMIGDNSFSSDKPYPELHFEPDVESLPEKKSSDLHPSSSGIPSMLVTEVAHDDNMAKACETSMQSSAEGDATESEENKNALLSHESEHSEVQKDISLQQDTSSELDANGLCADSKTTFELTALSEKCSADNAAIDSFQCDTTAKMISNDELSDKSHLQLHLELDVENLQQDSASSDPHPSSPGVTSVHVTEVTYKANILEACETSTQNNVEGDHVTADAIESEENENAFSSHGSEHPELKKDISLKHDHSLGVISVFITAEVEDKCSISEVGRTSPQNSLEGFTFKSSSDSEFHPCSKNSTELNVTSDTVEGIQSFISAQNDALLPMQLEVKDNELSDHSFVMDIDVKQSSMAELPDEQEILPQSAEKESVAEVLNSISPILETEHPGKETASTADIETDAAAESPKCDKFDAPSDVLTKPSDEQLEIPEAIEEKPSQNKHAGEHGAADLNETNALSEQMPLSLCSDPAIICSQELELADIKEQSENNKLKCASLTDDLATYNLVMNSAPLNEVCVVQEDILLDNVDATSVAHEADVSMESNTGESSIGVDSSEASSEAKECIEKETPSKQGVTSEQFCPLNSSVNTDTVTTDCVAQLKLLPIVDCSLINVAQETSPSGVSDKSNVPVSHAEEMLQQERLSEDGSYDKIDNGEFLGDSYSETLVLGRTASNVCVYPQEADIAMEVDQHMCDISSVSSEVHICSKQSALRKGDSTLEELSKFEKPDISNYILPQQLEHHETATDKPLQIESLIKLDNACKMDLSPVSQLLEEPINTPTCSLPIPEVHHISLPGEFASSNDATAQSITNLNSQLSFGIQVPRESQGQLHATVIDTESDQHGRCEESSYVESNNPHPSNELITMKASDNKENVRHEHLHAEMHMKRTVEPIANHSHMAAVNLDLSTHLSKDKTNNKDISCSEISNAGFTIGNGKVISDTCLPCHTNINSISNIGKPELQLTGIKIVTETCKGQEGLDTISSASANLSASVESEHGKTSFELESTIAPGAEQDEVKPEENAKPITTESLSMEQTELSEKGTKFQVEGIIKDSDASEATTTDEELHAYEISPILSQSDKNEVNGILHLHAEKCQTNLSSENETRAENINQSLALHTASDSHKKFISPECSENEVKLGTCESEFLVLLGKPHSVVSKVQEAETEADAMDCDDYQPEKSNPSNDKFSAVSAEYSNEELNASSKILPAKFESVEKNLTNETCVSQCENVEEIECDEKVELVTLKTESALHCSTPLRNITGQNNFSDTCSAHIESNSSLELSEKLIDLESCSVPVEAPKNATSTVSNYDTAVCLQPFVTLESSQQVSSAVESHEISMTKEKETVDELSTSEPREELCAQEQRLPPLESRSSLTKCSQKHEAQTLPLEKSADKLPDGLLLTFPSTVELGSKNKSEMLKLDENTAFVSATKAMDLDENVLLPSIQLNAEPSQASECLEQVENAPETVSKSASKVHQMADDTVPFQTPSDSSQSQLYKPITSVKAANKLCIENLDDQLKHDLSQKKDLEPVITSVSFGCQASVETSSCESTSTRETDARLEMNKHFKDTLKDYALHASSFDSKSTMIQGLPSEDTKDQVESVAIVGTATNVEEQNCHTCAESAEKLNESGEFETAKSEIQPNSEVGKKVEEHASKQEVNSDELYGTPLAVETNAKSMTPKFENGANDFVSKDVPVLSTIELDVKLHDNVPGGQEITETSGTALVEQIKSPVRSSTKTYEITVATCDREADSTSDKPISMPDSKAKEYFSSVDKSVLQPSMEYVEEENKCSEKDLNVFCTSKTELELAEHMEEEACRPPLTCIESVSKHASCAVVSSDVDPASCVHSGASENQMENQTDIYSMKKKNDSVEVEFNEELNVFPSAKSDSHFMASKSSKEAELLVFPETAPFSVTDESRVECEYSQGAKGSRTLWEGSVSSVVEETIDKSNSKTNGQPLTITEKYVCKDSVLQEGIMDAEKVTAIEISDELARELDVEAKQQKCLAEEVSNFKLVPQAELGSIDAAVIFDPLQITDVEKMPTVQNTNLEIDLASEIPTSGELIHFADSSKSKAHELVTEHEPEIARKVSLNEATTTHSNECSENHETTAVLIDLEISAHAVDSLTPNDDGDDSDEVEVLLVKVASSNEKTSKNRRYSVFGERNNELSSISNVTIRPSTGKKRFFKRTPISDQDPEKLVNISSSHSDETNDVCDTRVKKRLFQEDDKRNSACDILSDSFLLSEELDDELICLGTTKRRRTVEGECESKTDNPQELQPRKSSSATKPSSSQLSADNVSHLSDDSDSLDLSGGILSESFLRENDIEDSCPFAAISTQANSFNILQQKQKQDNRPEKKIGTKENDKPKVPSKILSSPTVQSSSISVFRNAKFKSPNTKPVPAFIKKNVPSPKPVSSMQKSSMSQQRFKAINSDCFQGSNEPKTTEIPTTSKIPPFGSGMANSSGKKRTIPTLGTQKPALKRNIPVNEGSRLKPESHPPASHLQKSPVPPPLKKIKTPSKYSKVLSPIRKYIEDVPASPLIEVVRPKSKITSLKTASCTATSSLKSTPAKEFSGPKSNAGTVHTLPAVKYCPKQIPKVTTGSQLPKPVLKVQNNQPNPVIRKHIGPKRAIPGIRFLKNEESMLDASRLSQVTSDMNATVVHQVDVSHSNTIGGAKKRAKFH